MSSRKKYLVCATSGLLVLLIYSFVDLWRVHGVAVEAVSGSPVPDAAVLVSLQSTEIRSPIPHAGSQRTRCLGSFILNADAKGRFETRKIFLGKPWAHKSILIYTFRPGWYGDKSYTKVNANTGLISGSEEIQINLHKDRDERWGFIHEGKLAPLTNDPESELYDLTMSKALTRSANLIPGEYTCGTEGQRMQLEVLHYALEHAATAAERRYVELQCVNAQNLLNARAGRTGAESSTIRQRAPLSTGVCPDVLATLNQQIGSQEQ
jgi:hypothetical protein